MDTYINLRATLTMLALSTLITAYLTGCSFKVEVGYHGQSGRDDRTQTQLLATQKKKVVKDDEY